MAYKKFISTNFINKNNENIIIEIFKNNYTGRILDNLNIQALSIQFGTANDDIDVLIKGTSVSLSLLVDGSLTVFNNVDKTDIILRLTDSSGVLFTGYYTPNATYEVVTNERYNVELQFTDPLSLLESFTYSVGTNNIFVPLINAFTAAFAAVDSEPRLNDNKNLNFINENINIKTKLGTDNDLTSFNYKDIQVRVDFLRDKNYKEILEAILKSTLSRIYYNRGAIYITSLYDNQSENLLKYKRYNEDSANISVNNTLKLSRFNDLKILSPYTIFTENKVGRVNLSQNLYNNNILDRKLKFNSSNRLSSGAYKFEYNTNFNPLRTINNATVDGIPNLAKIDVDKLTALFRPEGLASTGAKVLADSSSITDINYLFAKEVLIDKGYYKSYTENAFSVYPSFEISMEMKVSDDVREPIITTCFIEAYPEDNPSNNVFYLIPSDIPVQNYGLGVSARWFTPFQLQTNSSNHRAYIAPLGFINDIDNQFKNYNFGLRDSNIYSDEREDGKNNIVEFSKDIIIPQIPHTIVNDQFNAGFNDQNLVFKFCFGMYLTLPVAPNNQGSVIIKDISIKDSNLNATGNKVYTATSQGGIVSKNRDIELSTNSNFIYDEQLTNNNQAKGNLVFNNTQLETLKTNYVSQYLSQDNVLYATGSFNGENRLVPYRSIDSTLPFQSLEQNLPERLLKLLNKKVINIEVEDILNNNQVFLRDNEYYIINSQSIDLYDNRNQLELIKLDIDDLFTSFDIIASANSVNEGSSITFTVNATNFNGSQLYWTIQPSARSTDFAVSSGSVNINSGTGSFSVTPLADTLTEGNENFNIVLSLTNGGTTVAISESITINDTSTTPPPTFNITPSASSVNEGSNITFNVTTNNFTGSQLFWTIQPSARSTDFNSMTGTVALTSGNGSFTLTPLADTLTEGNETFNVVLSETSGGSVVATSINVTINDTSNTTILVNNPTNPQAFQDTKSTNLFIIWDEDTSYPSNVLFDIERRDTINTTYTLIATVDQSTLNTNIVPPSYRYRDSGTSQGETYRYRVRAKVGSNTSNWVETDIVTVVAPLGSLG